MIVIDIPMPESCMICPCSYYIQNGEHEGRLMCNAMEFRENNSGYAEEIDRFFVQENDNRPDGCPIRMELIK